MPVDQEHRWMTPANGVTIGRGLCAPLLVIVATWPSPVPFLGLFLVLLLSDIIDGRLARRGPYISRYGAQLDSLADIVLYASTGLGVWLRRPDIVAREGPLVALALGFYLVSVVVGLAKHGHLPSYHTWSAKVSTASVGISTFFMLADVTAWPFRVAIGLFMVASVEQIVITILLPRWRPNIRTLFDLRRPAIRDRR